MRSLSHHSREVILSKARSPIQVVEKPTQHNRRTSYSRYHNTSKFSGILLQFSLGLFQYEPAISGWHCRLVARGCGCLVFYKFLRLFLRPNYFFLRVSRTVSMKKSSNGTRLDLNTCGYLIIMSEENQS